MTPAHKTWPPNDCDKFAICQDFGTPPIQVQIHGTPLCETYEDAAALIKKLPPLYQTCFPVQITQNHPWKDIPIYHYFPPNGDDFQTTCGLKVSKTSKTSKVYITCNPQDVTCPDCHNQWIKTSGSKPRFNP